MTKKTREKMFPKQLFIKRTEDGAVVYFESYESMEDATGVPTTPPEHVAIYELVDVHLVHSEVKHESVKNPEVKS